MKPSKLFRALRDDQRGNVLMIFGFSLIPMVFATGMGIDYARAMTAQTKLNAAADAAALAAVSQAMMNESNKAACEKAQDMFVAQARGLPGIILTEDSPLISMKDADGVEIKCAELSDTNGASQSRTVTVAYTGTSDNIFGGILGWSTLAVGGSSDTYASVAPNIDFYIALDTSPSMALPTTSSGITTLENTIGCAFACHSNKIENNVQSGTGHMNTLIVDKPSFKLNKGNYGTGSVSEVVEDTNNCVRYTGTGSKRKCAQYGTKTIYHPYTIIDSDGHYVFDNKPNTSGQATCSVGGLDKCVRNGTPSTQGEFADSYWYALNQGIRLRVMDERYAIQDLMTLAKTYSQTNEADYRAALYSFDHAKHGTNGVTTIASLSSSLDSVSGAAQNASLVLVNDKTGGGCPATGCTNYPGNRYLFTSYSSILTRMSSLIPNPGLGTKAVGDKPQAFLFMVTDGMSDEEVCSSGNSCSSGTRTRAAMQQAQIAQCNALKARKVKIAILYTEYTYESIRNDEAGQRAIAERAIKGLNGQKSIAQALTECASPGLMYTVKTDESITNALQSLFSKALAAARIIR